VSDQEQLSWEARMGRPAALAAIVSGVLLLASTVLRGSIAAGRKGAEPAPDFLLGVHDSPGTLIASSAVQAIAVLLLIVVFLYLFRAIVHRAPEVPRWFVYLVYLGPAMYALGQALSAVASIDAADEFASGTPILGQAGDDRATDLLQDNSNPLGLVLGIAGSVGTAFLFVMLPLRARRVGLLSPFMGILGVIAGVLLVLGILPGVPAIVQAFWLGALGALFLGRWPGGRGPAWETGEAVPWPQPARRRGLLQQREEGDRSEDDRPEPAEEPEPAALPEGEDTPRRASRKRKRKRR
jgi:hypothetical protein